MLYLIDSSARNLSGHNLEYLLRISETTKSPFVILGNKEISPDQKSNYRPTFEFATWDFGRFGFHRNKLSTKKAKESKTLRASKSLIITELLIEMSAQTLARFAGRFLLLLLRYSKQSRYFHRDLVKGLCNIEQGATILFSTTNTRELVGIYQWTRDFPVQEYPISVILRRPLLDLRSYLEVPFILFDAIIYISAVRALRNRARFFADTPGLAARLSNRILQTIRQIPALGFDLEISTPKGPRKIAIAPNSRIETRFSAQYLTSIPELIDRKEINLDSKSYRKLLMTTKTIVLPYDPLRYRTRSSGIFAEALTLGIFTIVPTGTSLSRELSKLNSKVLPTPDYIVDLAVGDQMDLGQFGRDDVIITLSGNFFGTFVLEISEGDGNTKISIHDFFGSDCLDSFIIRPSEQTLMSFKLAHMFLRGEGKLNIRVNKVTNSLFGIPYLEGEVLEAAEISKLVTFSPRYLDLVSEHSPKSICRYLGI